MTVEQHKVDLLDVYAENHQWLNLLFGGLMVSGLVNVLSFLSGPLQFEFDAIAFLLPIGQWAAYLAVGISALVARMTDTKLARMYCYIGTICVLGLVLYWAQV